MRISVLEKLKNTCEYFPETGIFLRKTPQKHNRWGVKAAGTRAETYHNGYAHVWVYPKRWPAHQLAWLWVYGSWADSMLDHINGDPSDNRICNLRKATPSQNGFNRKISNNNISSRKGVCWHKNIGKYAATITVNYKQKHLGLFNSFEEAVQVREEAERLYHGSFRRLF